MLMTFRQEIPLGSRIPLGYGLAWWRPNALSAYVFPLGINWIAWAVRAGYLWLIRGAKPGRFEQELQSAYIAGFDAGYKVGQSADRKSAEWREAVILEGP